MSPLDPALFYDFNKLAAVCKELDFAYEQLAADEFKVILRDDLYIVFINLMDDKSTNTLVYMDEFQHTHGIDLEIGAYTYYKPVHYLDVLLLIRTGELLIYESYYRKKLRMRWLVHCTDLTNEFEDLDSGDEIRIIRL